VLREQAEQVAQRRVHRAHQRDLEQHLLGPAEQAPEEDRVHQKADHEHEHHRDREPHAGSVPLVRISSSSLLAEEVLEHREHPEHEIYGDDQRQHRQQAGEEDPPDVVPRRVTLWHGASYHRRRRVQ
jgi:hypothetical protein